MKQLLTLLSIVVCLVSCTFHRHDVQLSNGAIIRATENDGRIYDKGQKVCVKQVNMYDWTIDNTGEMKDTITYRTVRIDSTDVGVVTEYRIGKILN